MYYYLRFLFNQTIFSDYFKLGHIWGLLVQDVYRPNALSVPLKE